MPPINQAALSVGVVVTSMAVAAAIAIYESPELQRMANDLRRKIAIALHSLGDGILPENPNGEPLFNRPEDAEGFLLQSTDVDADDETRRRQREELMYWNAMKLSTELDKHNKALENERRPSSTFDDFLQEDKTADEKGTYVYNTGADTRSTNDDGLVRRRGASEGVRGLNASLYANPFADEHGIDYDEQLMDESHISPERDEVLSDIYNATPKDTPASLVASRTMSPEPVPDLIPLDAAPQLEPQPQPEVFAQSKSVSQPSDAASQTDSAASSERLAQEECFSAATDSQNLHDAYASIQQWAQQQRQSSSRGMDFYSPLPVTPTSAMSDGEMVSEGQLTPTDSVSVVDVDVSSATADESASQDGAASARAAARYYDVMSESEDGFATPAHSWTEVGSVVSESEDGSAHAVRA